MADRQVKVNDEKEMKESKKEGSGRQCIPLNDCQVGKTGRVDNEEYLINWMTTPYHSPKQITDSLGYVVLRS